jgi:phage-related protein
MDIYSANGFLNMAANIKSSSGEIDSETKALAADILSSFDNLPEDMDNAGRQALLGMITGLDDEIPQLKDASKMTANEIVDTITQFLGIHSPSTVLAEVGENAAKGLEQGLEKGKSSVSSAADQMATVVIAPFNSAWSDMYYAGQQMASGVWSGFSSQEWSLTQNVRYMMRRVTNAVKSEMQIASPSKVFAQIGDYMAQGLEVGFTDEMRSVTDSIRDSMPTSFDYPQVEKNSYSDDLVDAFKEALSEMKIELDDETVGGFVDRTVTKLVYT